MNRFAQMRRWRPGQLARNSGLSLVWQVVRTFCLAAYLLLLTRLLGPSSYGILSGPLAMAMMFGYLGGGGAGLMMFRDSARSAAGLSTAWSRLWSASLISMPVCLAAYAVVTNWLLPGVLSPRIWIPLGIAEIAMAPFTNAAALAFQSVERFNWGGAISTLPALARLSGAIILFFLDPPDRLDTYVWIHLGMAMAAAAIGVFTLRSRFALSWKLTALSRSWWRDCLGFSTMYFVSGASIDLDKTLVLRNADAATAGLYSAGYRIMSVLTFPAIALIQAMSPRLMRNDAESVSRRLNMVAAAALATVLYSIAAAMILYWCGERIIVLFGLKFAGLSGVLPGLGVLLVIYNLRIIPGAVLQSVDRPAMRAGVEASALPVLYAASAWLVPRFGLHGAVAAAIVSEAWIFVASWGMSFRLLQSRRPSSPALS